MKSWLIWKDPDAGRDWRQEQKGMTEDEMAGWHHRLNGHGSGSWWWTGRPGVQQSMGSRSRTRLSNWTDHFGINQGFLCSLISKSEFPPKADPNAKTQAQVVYLGDEPRKQGPGDRQKEMRQEGDVIAEASLRNLLLRKSGAQSFWTLFREPYRNSQTLSPWRTEYCGRIYAWAEQTFFISEKVRK